MDNTDKNYIDCIKEALDSKPKMSDLADRIIDMNDSEYWEMVRKISEEILLEYKKHKIENKKKEIEKDFE